MVHLYDTTTDIAVLIEWYILAYDNIDYKSIDMHIMFWTSIGFLIFYRAASTLMACVAGFLEDSVSDMVSNCCLGLLDMYVIKTVYQSLKLGHVEATPQQKAIQLLESVFESLPQVLSSDGIMYKHV